MWPTGRASLASRLTFWTAEAREADDTEEEEFKMHMVIESLEVGMEITKCTTTKARLRR
jgi:hypothetical protein